MRLRAFVFVWAALPACAVAPATSPNRTDAPVFADRVRLEDAVLPYSYELQNAEPQQPPFAARFERADQHLFYVASEHGCDPRTFRLIDDVFASHQVAFVVIEGYPASQGINPVGLTRRFPDWAAKGFCEGGAEGAYAASRGLERGAPFMGAEPDERTVAQAVLQEGYAPEDLLGFYFVRQVPTLRREGTLAAKGLEASFQWLMAWMAKAAGLQETSAHFSLEQFRDWYAKKQGKPFDAATLDNEEPAPIAHGAFLTQRISAVVGRVRDRFIVRVIADHLATEKTVLVVYGGSHFATQRPAFELLLGKPVETEPPHRTDPAP